MEEVFAKPKNPNAISAFSTKFALRLLHFPTSNSKILFMDNNQSQNLDNLRHSCAHLLAAAVMELYPKAKRTIGPSIENGFYYDFDFGDIKISDADLPNIETKMKEILPQWKSFERSEVSNNEAI